MNSKDVLIFDYGVGNLHSVLKGLEYVGSTPTISSDPDDLLKYEKIVLPGVGAFENGILALKKNGADQALLEAKKKGSYILAICLGMQMLVDRSEEFGIHQGLGLIPGDVKRIPDTINNGLNIKIPHIGWNKVYPNNNQNKFSSNYLNGFQNNFPEFYFVHSYRVIPKFETDCVGICNYEGHTISAIIEKENVTGCQFHPEKSGKAGLQLLSNFINL